MKTKNDNTINAINLLKQDFVCKAIQEILKDYVIFWRVERAMFNMHNVFAPDRKEGLDWEADQQFSGYSSIFELLNISEIDDLCNTLGEITCDVISESDNEANKVAEKLFTLWMHEIKKHFA